MPTAAAQRARQAEQRRKRNEYMRRYRELHSEELRQKRKDKDAAKRAEQEQATSPDRLYSRYPRYACVVGEHHGLQSDAVIEHRPFEPKLSRFLVKFKQNNVVTVKTFPTYEDCRKYLKSKHIRKMKFYRDLSQEWTEEHKIK